MIFLVQQNLLSNNRSRNLFFFLRRTVFNKLIFDDYFSTMGTDCGKEIFENVKLFLKLKKKLILRRMKLIF